MEKDNANRREPQFEVAEFGSYLNSIIHSWSKIITLLGIVFIPLFFILDYLMTPTRELLLRFGIYRFVTTSIVIIQYLVLRYTRAGKYSLYHGYFFSVIVGAMIVLMTVDLGGFNTRYYAGLNLIIIAIIILPWGGVHTAINCILIVLMYLTANGLWGGSFSRALLANNVYFMCTTAVVAVCISHVKQQLIKREFFVRRELMDTNKYLDQSRKELEEARDALWGEMEIAKRIQTSLLPNEAKMMGYYRTAATMEPAMEVGGDYYDLIPRKTGELWVTIGDVSGHGVEAGLIMMMTQTSVSSLVRSKRGLKPSSILSAVNTIMKENISRLGSDHYMSISLICLDKSGTMTVAGKHQDIMIHRSSSKSIEVIPTEGTWIGIFEDIRKYLSNVSVQINTGDIILLFTDGVTEAVNKEGELFGQERLEQALNRYSHLELESILEEILREVRDFQEAQNDDITLVLTRGCCNG